VALTDNLISYWSLDESSGDAIDAHGSNDLTDTNTVGAATGKISGARDFEAGSVERFYHADSTDFSVGDIDFTWAGWFQLESKSTYNIAICKATDKFTTGQQIEYRLYYDVLADRFAFTVGNNTTSLTVEAGTLGSPSTATWYYIVCWHDATANTINIQVNDGTVDSLSYSGGSWDSGGFFFIGLQYADDDIGSTWFPWDGLIDEVGFWKRVLTSGERTSLYNGGAGLAYPFSSGFIAYPRPRGLVGGMSVMAGGF